MTEPDSTTELPVSPVCLPTVERLQLVLDGELPASVLTADPHPVVYATCRERIAGARLILRALTLPSGTLVPASLTNSILAAVHEERYTRIRRRSYAVAGGAVVAIVASLLLLSWFTGSPPNPVVPLGPLVIPDQANRQPIPPVAPEPHAVRLGDEFSKVGQALIDTSKPITAPAASAPRVLAILTGSITRPVAPVAPVAEFEPARKSLADLPDAARTGFEPVTSTTQKAFARLMRDVGAVQMSAKPKS